METREEFQSRLNDLLNETDEMIKEARNYLITKGVPVDLSEWVTIKEYCRRFNIKNTETVSNWVKRGVIPAEDTMLVEEFNNTRMIRAKDYHMKSPKVA